jgi:hypothetical protein
MPRSPSRDLADRYIGNRDYFQQPDWIRRAKHWLALAALGITVGWLVFDRVMPSRAAYTHTHGPLADVHAAFDSNCEACHQGYSLRDFGPVAVFNTRERWHALTCDKCHGGPAHHATVTEKGSKYHDGCANCHHDHQGRTNPLVRIADRHCTECHANLPANTAGGGPKYEHKVTAFAKDHPEFRVLKESEGKPFAGRTLKFSHSVHMTEGITYHKDARGKWTLERIADKTARDRYRKGNQPDTAPVQLECASCHRLDSGTRYDANTHEPAGEFDRLMRLAQGQPRSALLPPRAAGAYYLPVNYETDCKACHAITAPPTVVGKDVAPGFAVPHRQQTDKLREILSGEYARLLSEGEFKGIELPKGPTGRLDPRADTGPASGKFRAEVDRLTTAAMASLFLGADPKAGPDGFPAGGNACGKCHARDSAGNVAAVPNRTVWFGHAKFDHVAHRAVRCADCHPGTDAKFKDGGETEWTDREPVLIAGVDTCKQCHAPAGTKVEAGGRSFVGGGVPADCALCHRYHNGDSPLQGRAARARDPLAPLSVEEFFRGKKKD